MGKTAGQRDGQTGRKDGQSEGQIDRWMTYLFDKRSDRESGKQTGRQMFKLGKESGRRWTSGRADMLELTETVCQKQGICAAMRTGRLDTSL